MGSPKVRRKVRSLKGQPGVALPYDSGADKRPPDDPWQDPGGGEPANGWPAAKGRRPHWRVEAIRPPPAARTGPSGV